MNKVVRRDILNVLDDSIAVLEKGKSWQLEEISNHIIQSATLHQDEDAISIAVMTYALYKAYSRKIVTDTKLFLELLKKAHHYLNKNDIESYRGRVSEVISDIAKYDSQLKEYVEEVLGKARLKKGSKMVEQGLSIAKVSELLGLTQWDLMSYLGKTKIIDTQNIDIAVKSRLETARQLFK